MRDLKRIIFEALWDSGERFNVGVDAALLPSEIEVPDRDDRVMALLLGKGLPKPINDMEITGEGFACSLSFPGIGWRLVKVPWSALHAVFVSGDFQAGWARDSRPPEPPESHAKLRIVK